MGLDPDFRVRTGFFGHHKRKSLQRLAGAEGVVCLFELWAWAANNRPNGYLTGLSNQQIADITCWPRESDKLIAALVTSELLDGKPGSYILHDYEEEQAWLQERVKRQEAGRKGAAVTNARLTPEQKSENAKKANAASQAARKLKKQNSIESNTFTRHTAQNPSDLQNVVTLTKIHETQKTEHNNFNDIHAARRVKKDATSVKNVNSVKIRKNPSETEKNQTVKTRTSPILVSLTKTFFVRATTSSKINGLQTTKDVKNMILRGPCPSPSPVLRQGSKEPLSLGQGKNKKNTGTRPTCGVSAPGFSDPGEDEIRAPLIVLPTGHLITAEQAEFRRQVAAESEPQAIDSDAPPPTPRRLPKPQTPPLPDPLPNQELAQRRLNEFRATQPVSNSLDKLFAVGLDGDTLIVSSTDYDIRSRWLFQNLTDLNDRLNRSGVFDCVRLEPR